MSLSSDSNISADFNQLTLVGKTRVYCSKEGQSLKEQITDAFQIADAANEKTIYLERDGHIGIINKKFSIEENVSNFKSQMRSSLRL